MTPTHAHPMSSNMEEDGRLIVEEVQSRIKTRLGPPGSTLTTDSLVKRGNDIHPTHHGPTTKTRKYPQQWKPTERRL